MLPRAYRTWIDSFVEQRQGKVAGLCHEATLAMQKEFPELILCHGFVFGRHHWWLETAEEEIVDPTAVQFIPFGGLPMLSDYVEYGKA